MSSSTSSREDPNEDLPEEEVEVPRPASTPRRLTQKNTPTSPQQATRAAEETTEMGPPPVKKQKPPPLQPSRGSEEEEADDAMTPKTQASSSIFSSFIMTEQEKVD